MINNRILVAQSAVPDMPPDRDPVLISYRHSMAGALILNSLDGWNPITHAVVDAMLDPKNDWQKSNGGWRQVSDAINTEDLWASAYAAKLMSYCVGPDLPFSKIERGRAQELLNLTLSFLEKQWNETHWAFGKLIAEEASVPLYIDLAEVLKLWRPDLVKQCLAQFESWLSQRGDLSDSFKEKLHDVPDEQLYARMAYAFYTSDKSRNIWKVLFERLAQGDFTKLNSADLAFALDMSFAYSLNDKIMVQPNSYVT